MDVIVLVSSTYKFQLALVAHRCIGDNLIEKTIPFSSFQIIATPYTEQHRASILTEQNNLRTCAKLKPSLESHQFKFPAKLLTLVISLAVGWNFALVIPGGCMGKLTRGR